MHPACKAEAKVRLRPRQTNQIKEIFWLSILTQGNSMMIKGLNAAAKQRRTT
jgi:hypothetical protein